MYQPKYPETTEKGCPCGFGVCGSWELKGVAQFTTVPYWPLLTISESMATQPQRRHKTAQWHSSSAPALHWHSWRCHPRYPEMWWFIPVCDYCQVTKLGFVFVSVCVCSERQWARERESLLNQYKKLVLDLNLNWNIKVTIHKSILYLEISTK